MPFGSSQVRFVMSLAHQRARSGCEIRPTGCVRNRGSSTATETYLGAWFRVGAMICYKQNPKLISSTLAVGLLLHYVFPGLGVLGLGSSEFFGFALTDEVPALMFAMAALCIVAVGRHIGTSKRSELDFPFVYENPKIAVIRRILALVCVLASVAAMLGAQFLGDGLEVERRNLGGLQVVVLNLHIVAAVLVSVNLASLMATRRIDQALFFAILAYGIIVGVLEARRTAAAFPLVALAYAFAAYRPVNWRLIGRAVLLGAVASLVFLSITIVRIPEDQHWLLAHAVFARLANSFLMLELVIADSAVAFDPETIRQVLTRLLNAFGLADYVTKTNEFGRTYQLLDPGDYATGINFGWIAELYLGVGVAGALLVLGALACVIDRLWRLAFADPLGLGVLGGVVVLLGMQMEIPFVVGSVLRLMLASMFVVLLFRLFGKRLLG